MELTTPDAYLLNAALWTGYRGAPSAIRQRLVEAELAYVDHRDHETLYASNKGRQALRDWADSHPSAFPQTHPRLTA